MTATCRACSRCLIWARCLRVTRYISTPANSCCPGPILIIARARLPAARAARTWAWHMIWPLGLIVQGLTSTDDQEIRQCLLTLQKTHAGTGFMHEAFNKDDPRKFTRSWFAWANTIFGELVLKTFQQNPRLLS